MSSKLAIGEEGLAAELEASIGATVLKSTAGRNLEHHFSTCPMTPHFAHMHDLK
jgi:hypothetical protein